MDSLHKLLGTRPDPRVTRDEVPPESAESATNADLVDLIRDLSAEVTRRSSEAAELRTRLELTERAESSLREALEQRLGTECILREQAERERDELATELEAMRETREAPQTPIEGEGSSKTPSEQQEPVEQRSWWRRLFDV